MHQSQTSVPLRTSTLLHRCKSEWRGDRSYVIFLSLSHLHLYRTFDFSRPLILFVMADPKSRGERGSMRLAGTSRQCSMCRSHLRGHTKFRSMVALSSLSRRSCAAHHIALRGRLRDAYSSKPTSMNMATEKPPRRAANSDVPVRRGTHLSMHSAPYPYRDTCLHCTTPPEGPMNPSGDNRERRHDH